MLSTPLICSSSGVATVSATVTGLAPGNCAVTCTDGGTTSGYSEIGSRGIAIRPARKITDEMTPAKIGRSIKNRDKDICDSRSARPLERCWLDQLLAVRLCSTLGTTG